MIRIRNYFLSDLDRCEWREDVSLHVFILESGEMGTIFRFPNLDRESVSYHSNVSKLKNLLHVFSPKVTVQFHTHGSFEQVSLYSRQSTFETYPGSRYDAYLSIEANSEQTFKSEINSIREWSRLIKECGGVGLGLRDLESYITSQIDRVTAQSHEKPHLCGALRLRRIHVAGFSESAVSEALLRLPMPFSLSLKLRKKAKVSVELSLRAKLNREKASNEVGTHTQAGSTETLLEEVKSEEAEVFEYEYLLTLQRFDEQSLRSDLAEAKRALSSFGVFEVEWVGLSPALIATLPGRDIHVNQSEKSEILLPLLPIHVTGESFTIPQSVPHSLPLHRLDGSVHHFDLFNRKFSASNCLITGRTGGGKSVFGNLLSRSLLTSPQIEMIKVDVGGSYSRECKLYQGLEIEFQLSKPSGLDPFALLSENVTHDELSVLSEFLSTLSLEEGESVLPKKERSVIEDALTAYIAGSKKPSFQEFLIKSKDLTRREILKRFGKGGIYENAISNANSRSIVDIRYLYYNFSNLVGATNQDYASCVMASVIAAVNLKMLRISKEKETGQIRRLVFFCDETKFFLHKNRKFFQLTVANFRKYGHSVILVSQSLDDFRFEDRNSTDDSLLLNCPVRVYFPSLASESTLKEVCGLTSEDSEWIRSNEMRAQSGARTLLLQDDLGVRRIQVILTKSEYWSTTSTLQDVALLQDLKSKLPWLTETQAIEIMTLSQSEMVS